MSTHDTPPEMHSTETELHGSGSSLNAETLLIAEKTEPGRSSIQRGSSPLRDSLRRLGKDARAMVSLVVILFFILIPLIGPPIYQRIGGPYESLTHRTIGPSVYHSPFNTEIDRQNEGPSAQYWLGTDAIGRDMLARLMQGLLISLSISIIVEIVNVMMGLTIGVLAGYYGGWIDFILARITDVMFAFPGVLFAILLTGIFGASADDFFGRIPIIGANGNARLILVSIALAMVSWPTMARLARGQALLIRQQQYIEAARTSGTSGLLTIIRHVIPNLLNIIIVAATLDIVNTIVGEAGLSFLGLGVQQPGTSIGLMIADNIKQIDSYPWQLLLPVGVLTIIVLAFSFLGDGLRDAFDPRLKDG